VIPLKSGIFNKSVLYILIASSAMSLSSCGLFGSGGDDTDPPISAPTPPPVQVDDPLRVTTEPSDKWTAPEDSKDTAKAPEDSTTLPETTVPEVTTAPGTEPPAVTTAPETEAPLPDGRNMSLSGRINPKDSNNLELHLEWTATQKADSPYATVTVKVYLDSYDIYVGLRDNCIFSINGEEKTFSTDMVSIKSEKLSSTLLYTDVTEILSPKGEKIDVPVFASFYFGNMYGSKKFDWLNVSGTITLKDTNSYSPENPVS